TLGDADGQAHTTYALPRVFEARPPFSGGTPSVPPSLRNANQTSCKQRSIKDAFSILACC
ncbi:MAG: hypothetical protein E7J78_25680, partial [Pantoea sp.]|nr:hypothetical protein [Pantoea sp.]